MKRVFRSYQELNSVLGFVFCPKGVMFGSAETPFINGLINTICLLTEWAVFGSSKLNKWTNGLKPVVLC